MQNQIGTFKYLETNVFLEDCFGFKFALKYARIEYPHMRTT
jgi:hypothetical protein